MKWVGDVGFLEDHGGAGVNEVDGISYDACYCGVVCSKDFCRFGVHNSVVGVGGLFKGGRVYLLTIAS